MLVKEKESAFTKIKFEPTINKRSQRLASLKFETITRSKSRKANLDKGKTTSRSATHEAPMKYEDFLISKAQQFKLKLQEKAKKLEYEQLQNCTFSPKINSSYRSSSKSNLRSTIGRVSSFTD